MKKSISKTLAKIAIFTALLCIVSPLSIPLGNGVSLSFATLIIFIASAVLNPLEAFISIAVYLIIGCVGVPVFQNFTGGISSIVGPTGGYLISYPVCALVSGLLLRVRRNFLWYNLSFFIGVIIVHTVGYFWFSYVTTGAITPSVLLITVVTFLPIDIVKGVCASLLSVKIVPTLQK